MLRAKEVAGPAKGPRSSLRLEDDSRVAVIGGGPAGSLFSFFLLDMAERLGVNPHVDIYEPRDFEQLGPKGCNMCGGIISETLVQNLASEGIELPPTVVQRGIDSYVLHMDVGSVRIETLLDEMRIGAVYRGGGPLDAKELKWQSFDRHLQSLALTKGARLLKIRVEAVSMESGKPALRAQDGNIREYDLVVAATGVNSTLLKLFENLGIGYERPRASKTLIREYYLGEETISRFLGSAMHVFLIRVPRLEFAAIIPKGDYVTMALLGRDLNNEVADAFVASPEVLAVMPPGWEPGKPSCQCLPCINVRGVRTPFADRFLFLGDCGVTRLYKDGIGAAYRTAKAAARAAVFSGISERAFRQHYLPVCRTITADNRIGRLMFLFTRFMQNVTRLRLTILCMAQREQSRREGKRLMSSVLWDLFTGSAPYKEIFGRMFHPAFWSRFFWFMAGSAKPNRSQVNGEIPR